jgi:hypothetical protein
MSTKWVDFNPAAGQNQVYFKNLFGGTSASVAINIRGMRYILCN